MANENQNQYQKYWNVSSTINFEIKILEIFDWESISISRILKSSKYIQHQNQEYWKLSQKINIKIHNFEICKRASKSISISKSESKLLK